MGLFQRVGEMNFRFQFDIKSNNIFCVYKITCIPTGHFYIGKTNNLKNRLYSHVDEIIKSIKFKDGKPLQMHKMFASIIENQVIKRKNENVEKCVKSSIDIEVLCIISDDEKLSLIIENYYISNNINNDLCLNKR